MDQNCKSDPTCTKPKGGDQLVNTEYCTVRVLNCLRKCAFNNDVNYTVSLVFMPMQNAPIGRCLRCWVGWNTWHCNTFLQCSPQTAWHRRDSKKLWDLVRLNASNRTAIDPACKGLLIDLQSCWKSFRGAGVATFRLEMIYSELTIQRMLVVCGGTCPVIRSIDSQQGWQSGYRRGTCLWYPFMLSYAENKRTWPAIVSQKSLAASEWFQFVLSRLRSNFQCEHAGSIQSSCPSAACFDCHAFAEQAGTILQSTEHRANGVGLGLLACLSSHISISNAENGFVRKPTPTSLASPCRAWSIRETGACSNGISTDILLHSGWLPLVGGV